MSARLTEGLVDQSGTVERVNERKERGTLRRILTGWLALELGAGILAISLLVAILPWVLVLLSRPEYPWVATPAVLAVSVPTAALFGSRAIMLIREVSQA